MARPPSGMLFATSAVASSMTCSAAGAAMALASCSDPPCAQQGFDVVMGTQTIIDVTASDVACTNVTPSCVGTDDAGTCTKYWVLPNDSGNCHVDVDLGNGTRFSADVKINRGTTRCSGFYPTVATDSTIEAP